MYSPRFSGFTARALTTLIILALLSPVSDAKETLSVAELQQRLEILENQVAEYKKLLEGYTCDGVPSQSGEVPAETVGKIKARHKLGSLFAEPYVPGNFKIGGNFTGILQTSDDTKLIGRGRQAKAGASYQANITLANKFTEIDGLAVANMRVSQGDGLENRYTLYSNVNNNAWGNDTFTLSEIFYEQNLFNGKAVIDFGKLDWTVYFDQSTYCGSDTSQFLARIFNHNPTLDTVANTGGVRAAIIPIKGIAADYIVLSGAPDMSNLGSNLFHMGQLKYSPIFGKLPGNYLIYGWLNTNEHIRWDDPARDKENAFGLGINADQAITDTVGIFGKFGWQDPRVYNPAVTANADPLGLLGTTPDINNFSLEYFWATGFELKGSLWGRKDDFSGVAIGQVIPSREMKKALEGTSNNRDAKNETHFEVYYNFRVNKYLAISPSAQIILDSYGGDAGSENLVAVYTLRSHVDF